MNCKFCQKEHSEFYTCYEHRLWRKIKDVLNKKPDKEIIFATAEILGLRKANKKKETKNVISTAKQQIND